MPDKETFLARVRALVASVDTEDEEDIDNTVDTIKDLMVESGYLRADD